MDARTRIRKGRVLALALALALVGTLAGIMAADEFGDIAATVVRVRAETLRFAEGKGDAVPVSLGDTLHVGDRITTDGHGSVGLILSDGSKFNLLPNSEFTVKQLGQDGAGGTVFELLKGVLQGAVRKLASGQRQLVQTPGGVAAVKGTQYQIEAGAEGTELKVLQGLVELSDPAGRGTLQVGPGMAAMSYPDRVGTVRRMTRDETEALRKGFAIQVQKAKDDYLKRVQDAQGTH